MTGQQKLYDSIVSKITSNEISNKEKRDNALVFRYFYYTEIKRMSFADAVHRLSNCFCLNEQTVIRYIDRNYTKLTLLSTRKPSLAEIEQNMLEYSFEVTKEERIRYNSLRRNIN